MTPLEKAARALHACYHNSKWETAGQLYQDMYRLHARAVISSIEVDDAMVEAACDRLYSSKTWRTISPDAKDDLSQNMRAALKAFLRSLLEGETGK